jgi:hypothetical protein
MTIHQHNNTPIHQHCDNIRNGYLYGGDLLFVILKGIYGSKFPTRFLEISFRDFSFLSILIIQRLDYPILVPVPFPFARLNALQAAVNISTVYQTHVFATLHKQNKNWLHLKNSLSSNEKERIGCNGGFCTALGADCNLSFGKLCKCISKS